MTASTVVEAFVGVSLCLVLFRCSLPLLIGRATGYVQAPAVEDEDGTEDYVLVVMAMTSYVGLAVSKPHPRDYYTRSHLTALKGHVSERPEYTPSHGQG
jgi:hypothetical protein